jgi:hypothetical protein
MRCVVLSSPVILEDGTFKAEKISLEDAKKWVVQNNPENFVGHSTVKAVGLAPSSTRAVCQGYDQALSLKVLGRLEFGKEYSEEEILAIGVEPTLICKIS